MRLSVVSALSSVALLGLVACKTDPVADDGKTPDPTIDTVVEAPDGITITTPEFTVPPGDSFTCFYMDYETAEELVIVNGDGKQGPGGHHIIAYFTDDPRPVGHHICDDAEMTNLNQISGNAGDGGKVLGLPEGLAIKVPKGKQIAVQAHYINTSGADMVVHDWVKIVKGDPAKVKSYVNYLVTNDDGFEIPPNAPLERETECTLEQDFQMAIALPHMHELGEHYHLEVVGLDGQVRDTLIDTDWELSYTSHPPMKSFEMAAPYVLKKGEKLRQKCTWDNATVDPVIFPREMCLSFFYYWPGGGDLECKMVPVAK